MAAMHSRNSRSHGVHGIWGGLWSIDLASPLPLISRWKLQLCGLDRPAQPLSKHLPIQKGYRMAVVVTTNLPDDVQLLSDLIGIESTTQAALYVALRK